MADQPERQAPPPAEQQSAPNQGGITHDEASIRKIQELLKTKNDTSRFVGLALLKSVLDNSADLRNDQSRVVQLWESIPPTFLRRLLRTGSRSSPSQKNAKDMLDLAVSVILTFSTLLPEDLRGNSALVDQIPVLVASILHRYQAHGRSGKARQEH